MENENFNQYFLQLVIGLQSGAWMGLGKVMNPMTGKAEINLERARDSIDTLIMLKEKTKGNLTQTEKGIMENSMHDLEMNYIEVAKNQPVDKKEETKEDNTTETPVKEKTEETAEKPAEPKKESEDQETNEETKDITPEKELNEQASTAKEPQAESEETTNNTIDETSSNSEDIPKDKSEEKKPEDKQD